MNRLHNEQSRFVRSIERPTLLLDRQRAIRNIVNMVRKAERSDVQFRPHFKTHQSSEIGSWFRQQGVTKITVSSVDMADYFARHAWEDITIAFPVNLRQCRALDSLAKKVRLGVVVESREVVNRIDKKLTTEVAAWLKIDVGYHRTGIAWDDGNSARNVYESVMASRHLRPAGLLTHAGHTYGAHPTEDIVEIYWSTLERMKAVKSQLVSDDRELAISVGDTPGCSHVTDFGDVDEVRPGNFVFYDLSQLQFGSCAQSDIAVAVACPIVAKHAERSQLVVYGGAIHLSKEYLPTSERGAVFGRVAMPTDDGWSPILEDCYVSSLSQEHGVITASQWLLESAQIGDVLIVLPVHSCLTANLFGRYMTLDGDIIEMARF